MANQSLPVLERQESVHTTSTPDFQSVTQGLAESQNNLSAIGAKVAQSASNQMAVQLGQAQGKTPHGDLMPPITEFDRNFAASYHAQANATLSLQGQKLIDDTQVQMSQANRLTPELIARTHEQLQAGLNKIAEQAPTAIKTDLQQQFDSHVLNQTTQYKERMIGEQREDQKNTVTDALDLATKNAFELARNGDIKGATSVVQSAKKMADNAVVNRFKTPEEARIAHESVVQASLDGKYTHLAMQALKEKKFAEFQRAYSESDPKKLGMTNEQFVATGQAFTQQVNFIENLRAQDENLKTQKILDTISLNAASVTGTQLKTVMDSVSPHQAEEINFKYHQALKAQQGETLGTDALVRNFSNPKVWANTTEKTQNAAFHSQVDHTLQQAQKSGNPISPDQAEVQVAAAAGGKVPVFVQTLKNKLNSGNPVYIESAAQQIHALEQAEAGHALQGLTDADHALYTAYESMRDSRDPVTAARDATAIVSNQDSDEIKQRWANKISRELSGSGYSHADYGLSTFNLKDNDFINPSSAQIYGLDIYNKYKSFYQLLNGDENSAKKLTQKYIDSNYGDTRVNGGSYKTMHPIEKTLGFNSSDGVPYIQQDVINQINPKLGATKALYDAKKTNEYWETVPLSEKKHGLFSTTYDPIQIKRHTRTKSGEMTDTFNVVLQGNAFDNWDVAVQTDTGLRNIFQIAPFLGIISYEPNAEAIRKSYNKDHQLKG